MFSAREMELEAESRIAEWREVILPAAERRARIEHDLQAPSREPVAPVWRAALGWLGARLVAAGERMRALGAVAAQPGTYRLLYTSALIRPFRAASRGGTGLAGVPAQASQATIDSTSENARGTVHNSL